MDDRDGWRENKSVKIIRAVYYNLCYNRRNSVVQLITEPNVVILVCLFPLKYKRYIFRIEKIQLAIKYLRTVEKRS